MTTIYTSKKNGKTYTMQALENGKFQLTNTEDHSDVVTTTESVLKRWYKKSVVVDFATAEPKPAKASKSRKARKPRAKIYEEQKWGLGHQRISTESLCEAFGVSDIKYDAEKQTVTLFSGADCIARRRAWPNELTGSVWFRFKNYEYELTDVSYVGA